eukprot:GHVU01133827.1.p2 GENE.GHVU01133827.1~~GHVU01133827.1.p2  ORF type:complete len:149 (+),score=37.68 GHVU01133827.1:147-593(+)
MKQRLGKGFSLEELKAAGVSKKAAHSIGIAVDHRRKNRSSESLTVNTKRLENYLARLVVFARRSSKTQEGKKKEGKRGMGGIPADKPKSAVGPVSQQKLAIAMPLPKEAKKEKARAITEEEKRFMAYATLRSVLRASKKSLEPAPPAE